MVLKITFIDLPVLLQFYRSIIVTNARTLTLNDLLDPHSLIDASYPAKASLE